MKRIPAGRTSREQRALEDAEREANRRLNGERARYDDMRLAGAWWLLPKLAERVRSAEEAYQAAAAAAWPHEV